MKKPLLTVSFLVISHLFFGQQLENANFESWENVGSPTVEPIDWSSLKTADALASTAPTVVSRDVGRNGTGYSVKLETKSVLGIAANGILTNGRVHADFNPANGYVFTDPNNASWNTAFAFRPDSLVGWYKYAPQNNDKGKFEVVLHTNEGKLPGMNSANVIGAAKFNATQATSTWKRFSVPFQYATSGNPSYALAVATSGDSTISQNGSIIWFDDVELVYNESSANTLEINQEKIYAWKNNDKIYFSEVFEQAHVQISTMDGKVMFSDKMTQEITWNQPTGIYLIDIFVEQKRITRKVHF